MLPLLALLAEHAICLHLVARWLKLGESDVAGWEVWRVSLAGPRGALDSFFVLSLKPDTNIHVLYNKATSRHLVIHSVKTHGQWRQNGRGIQKKTTQGNRTTSPLNQSSTHQPRQTVHRSSTTTTALFLGVKICESHQSAMLNCSSCQTKSQGPMLLPSSPVTVQLCSASLHTSKEMSKTTLVVSLA